jgi:predicted DNA-binding transcriptional regulator AlpA
MRAEVLQAAKILELGEALIAAGHLRLDDQATLLGLSRSTTWTIVRAKHKATGLSASVIKRMLAQPRLPAMVRIKIFEYVDQKSAGMYGHNATQVRRFVEALSPLRPGQGGTSSSNQPHLGVPTTPRNPLSARQM